MDSFGGTSYGLALNELNILSSGDLARSVDAFGGAWSDVVLRGTTDVVKRLVI